MPRCEQSAWELIEIVSHRPDGQEAIRRGIEAGIIRVLPAKAGRIRIVPVISSHASKADNAPVAISDRFAG